MADVTHPLLFQWFQDCTAKNYRLEGIADMVEPFKTNYVWDSQVDNYHIQNNERIVFVFRRRDS